MKSVYNRIVSVMVGRGFSQDELIDFIRDEKNIQKAAEGSMQKRIDLIDRVKLRKKHA